MTKDSSAPTREETPPATGTTKTADIISALKTRTQSILNNPSIPPENRALLRYALEVNDPWLAKLVGQIEADNGVNNESTASQTFKTDEEEEDPSESKIEKLVDLICRPGDEPETKSTALVVLMSALEKSLDPEEVAKTAKHFAFAHYHDLTIDDMIDSQIARFETELSAGKTPLSSRSI